MLRLSDTRGLDNKIGRPNPFEFRFSEDVIEPVHLL